MNSALIAVLIVIIIISIVSTGFCVYQKRTNYLTIMSSAFEHGKQIPKHYTCEGKDVSPPLAWSGVPQGTKSFVLIFEDPDAPQGTWTHWIMFNIPAHVRGIPEGVHNTDLLAREGKNSWGRGGYGGPCPPQGTHRYYFKLYALDVMLDSHELLTAQQLQNMMKQHILAQGQLMGTYKKQTSTKP